MKTLQDYISEALLRWNAPMPPFFKPLYQASLLLLIVCAGLVCAQSTLAEYNLHVPNWLTIAAGVAGSVGTFLTKLTLDRDRLSLGQKRELSRFNSPWWLSAGLVVGHWGPLGWLIVSAALGWLLYWPLALVVRRVISRSMLRLQRHFSYEPEAFKEARRQTQAQATIRQTDAMQLFGDKLREKGYTNADDIDEIKQVLTGV